MTRKAKFNSGAGGDTPNNPLIRQQKRQAMGGTLKVTKSPGGGRGLAKGTSGYKK